MGRSGGYRQETEQWRWANWEEAGSVGPPQGQLGPDPSRPGCPDWGQYQVVAATLAGAVRALHLDRVRTRGRLGLPCINRTIEYWPIPGRDRYGWQLILKQVIRPGDLVAWSAKRDPTEPDPGWLEQVESDPNRNVSQAGLVVAVVPIGVRPERVVPVGYQLCIEADYRDRAQRLRPDWRYERYLVWPVREGGSQVYMPPVYRLWVWDPDGGQSSEPQLQLGRRPEEWQGA